MSLKSSVGKLYMLLSACIPENEFVKKQLLVSEILEMNEYLQLKYSIGNQELFKKQCTEECFQTLSIEELIIIKENIPLFLDLMRTLYMAIFYGNGWTLKADDAPNILSVFSLKKLEIKLDISNVSVNSTNLTQDNYLIIFEDSTIKNSEIPISQLIQDGKKFCIDGNELALKEQIKE